MHNNYIDAFSKISAFNKSSSLIRNNDLKYCDGYIAAAEIKWLVMRDWVYSMRLLVVC